MFLDLMFALWFLGLVYFVGWVFVDCVELPVMMTCLLWVLFGFPVGVCLFVLCLLWVCMIVCVWYLIV